ncbi:glycerol-3-phosphate-acyltransferase [Cylindrobasidium torrendii FP15055 ss-10]|uniref:Glycerol-3-phosphate-acyltransferase n=1 Tax=Cylindrobasidium torrendii FP15055 ss-10 TaxID=1314674 RepID=A0A0D7BFT8_9AGAR|nr:glycerol-3-phosphate-acyltransferase [Cylindrobasidium torrendii FP15055 ss-10]
MAKKAVAEETDYFVLHRIIRYVAKLSSEAFFSEIRVIGAENVPKVGPIILAATHHNMMLDPAVLSTAFPHDRILHYWSKASLYANPIMRYILLSTGNIPVDRKAKDRLTLFDGTFTALSQGGAVALFPEGTSYTEPRIMQVKDGVSWALLEFSNWLEKHPEKDPGRPVYVIPTAMVYTNKSKYRSSVVVEFGRPISSEEYMAQFRAPDEGATRATAKVVTGVIKTQLEEMTVNAPDWDTLYAARMARDLLWEQDGSIPLEEFVHISQTIVDLFCNDDATTNMVATRRALTEYYSLLQSTNLTNSLLTSLPLPRTLDPRVPTPIPSRLYTLLLLFRDSLSSVARLPFFLFPVVVHMPVYIMGRLGARLVDNEEETLAQNKVVFGLLTIAMVYPASFFFLWALFWYTRTGAVAAFAFLALFATYHNRMINDNYEHAKRLVATWRILIGVWAPKRMDLSLNALAQYTTPVLPKENPWIERPKKEEEASTPVQDLPKLLPDDPNLLVNEPPAKLRRKRRPQTRRIMRHLLRARVEAVKAVASLFDQLERSGSAKRLRSSAHLARRFGWMDGAQGMRSAAEVIQYLIVRGAKIPAIRSSADDADWVALSSDGEGTSTAYESSTY